jgi:hypothetical protein
VMMMMVVVVTMTITKKSNLDTKSGSSCRRKHNVHQATANASIFQTTICIRASFSDGCC